MKLISTSTVGKHRNILEAVQHIKEAVIIHNRGPMKLEIGVGPAPVDNDDDYRTLLELLLRTRIVGHGMLPLGKGRIINPYTNFDTIINACISFGLYRYSMHPPTKKTLPTWDHFLVWTYLHHVKCETVGLPFALETMYPDPSGHWLSSFDETLRFIEYAYNQEWVNPLVVDAAHLRIGKNAGTWTDEQIKAVLKLPYIAEVHYSSNDGKRDTHIPYRSGRDTDIEDWFSVLPYEMDMVDEGRRDSFDGSSWDSPR